MSNLNLLAIYIYELYSNIYTDIKEKGKRIGISCDYQRAFWSSLSFQFKQRIKLRNQSPVWSHLLTVGSGCWLIDIRTESPLESCCLLFPSNETQQLLRASSGICLSRRKEKRSKDTMLEILFGHIKFRNQQ